MSLYDFWLYITVLVFSAMQFGQLLTHLDTTQQMINNSLKDNSTLLTQVCDHHSVLESFFINLIFIISFVGPANYEGEPGCSRRELCWPGSENEEALQIKALFMWGQWMRNSSTIFKLFPHVLFVFENGWNAVEGWDQMSHYRTSKPEVSERSFQSRYCNLFKYTQYKELPWLCLHPPVCKMI